MSLKIHLNWFLLSGNKQIIHYLPSLSSIGQPCRWCHRSRRQRKLSAPATPTQQKVYLERGRRGEGAGTTQPLVCADEWSDPLPPTAQHSAAQHSTAHLPSLLLQECLRADGLSCWIPIRSGPGSASPVSIPPHPPFSLNSPTRAPSPRVFLCSNQLIGTLACVCALLRLLLSKQN